MHWLPSQFSWLGCQQNVRVEICGWLWKQKSWKIDSCWLTKVAWYLKTKLRCWIIKTCKSKLENSKSVIYVLLHLKSCVWFFTFLGTGTLDSPNLYSNQQNYRSNLQLGILKWIMKNMLSEDYISNPIVNLGYLSKTERVNNCTHC